MVQTLTLDMLFFSFVIIFDNGFSEGMLVKDHNKEVAIVIKVLSIVYTII